ncbi:hypothetical protein PLESTB_001222600 [Pleodorina starrii]|uniref:Uncharacterized protein n=1 Tax=Pleodorina starrii TaxID=330485 RepID=A0A9W6F6D9_9CHLO|nr:hypothetical protein PLESTB_001222600 [Pleodorina starrii]GLC77058.1 hypothetical protein PLESTF_001878800 [Pleodorina starrii]
MEGTRIKHRFQGPQLLSSAESSENAVTLRLLAIGAEVLTLEKLPPGISVIDEDESSPDTYSVPRRSSRIVRVCWCPDGAAAVLHDSLRWRMTEGLRQARLEVRLQGVTSELPTPARSSRTAAPPATKISDMRVPNKCAENKRERALISWMNSEVAPLGTAASVAGGSGVEGHQVRRLLGEVTGKAYTYFKRDEGFAAMASKLEAKIAAKQLVIRDAEHTLSDVRMRQQALEVLTSYHPFWLAVGLQTVLGRALVFTHGTA